MKLRLNEHAVRLRFRKSEVLELSETGRVSVTLTFPVGTPITFRAAASPVSSLRVSFSGGVIEVLIPSDLARNWHSSNEVGIYGNHGGVEVLLEKDFRRSAAPSPDDADRYPNPRRMAAESAGSVVSPELS